MTGTTIEVEIQLRYDDADVWTANNPILKIAEFGYESNTGKVKFGDGVTPWNDLLYWEGTTGPPGADGTDGAPGPTGPVDWTITNDDVTTGVALEVGVAPGNPSGVSPHYTRHITSIAFWIKYSEVPTTGTVDCGIFDKITGVLVGGYLGVPLDATTLTDEFVPYAFTFPMVELLTSQYLGMKNNSDKVLVLGAGLGDLLLEDSYGYIFGLYSGSHICTIREETSLGMPGMAGIKGWTAVHSDGDIIAHGFAGKPHVGIRGSVPQEITTCTVDATNITISIKTPIGEPGTPQEISVVAVYP
jgi:hypothetical protein